MPKPWVALASAVTGTHSQAFQLAARDLVRLDLVNPGSLSVDMTRGRARIRAGAVALPPYDGAIFRRIDARKSFDFQMLALKEWEARLPAAVNAIAPMLTALDKLAVLLRLQADSLPVPKTLVVQDMRAAEEHVRNEGLVVAKPLYGSMGEGVELWRPDEGLKHVIPEYLADYGVVMLQEYIPSGGRDVRVFVVGEQAVAACTRQAVAGEWRTNVAQGGTPEPLPVTTELANLAVRAVRSIGLAYSGVDLIESPSGWRILEVNGSPSFEGVSRATGVDVARLILEHLVAEIEKSGRRAA